jgi:hypothetical protein
MNLKIDDIFTLNVMQVAMDDLIEHLRDLPSHDPDEAREFSGRLRIAETLKLRLDQMQEVWPAYERLREWETAFDRRVAEREQELIVAQMKLDAGIYGGL